MRRTAYVYWVSVICVFITAISLNTAAEAAYPNDKDSWVRVDSTTVNGSWFTAGSDTAEITVHMSNPIATHPFEFPAQIIISNNLIGYEWISDPQTVVLPGGGQASATFSWADTLATPFLQYDITARLLIPLADKENIVVNGNFEGGLGGWELTQNNPPGWGIEHGTLWDGDSDGEAHVYMTIYDTEGYQPQILQRVQLPDGDESFIHLRFRMDTEDVLWGMGIGLIGLQRGSGTYGFWRASEPPPSDTPTQHIVWVTSGWWEAQLTADQIPGGTGDELIIYSRAMMSTAMGYGQVEVDIYLDDIGVSDNDPTYIEQFSAYTWTGLDTDILGTYEDLLTECLHDSYPGDAEKVFDTLPLLGTLNMWDNMHNHICAAGIYQNQGREIHKNLALLQAFFSLYEGPVEMVELTTGAHVIGVASILDNTMVIADVIEPMEGESVTPANARDAVLAMADIAGEAGLLTREQMMVYGDMTTTIELLGVRQSENAFVSVDSLGMTHSWITELSPDNLTWCLVGQNIRVLGDELPLGAEETLRFSFKAESDVETNIAFLHNNAGQPEQYVLEGLEMSAGDLLRADISGLMDSFIFKLDRGGDGTVDSTMTIQPIAPGPVPPPVASLRLTSYPNPFNPHTTIAFDLPERSDVELSVFDLAGRLVRVLVSGETYSAGHYETLWDGRDDTARQVSSGTYFYRLKAGKYSETKRMALIK